jgi:hypothetical protein
LRRRRFDFAAITFSVPPDDTTFEAIFGQTLHLTPDSLWHKTSQPDEVPLDRSRSSFAAVAAENAALYSGRSYTNRRGAVVSLASLIAQSATTPVAPGDPISIGRAASISPRRPRSAPSIV